MDKYVEAEFRLAALLGWKIKSMYDVATGWHDPAGKYQPNLPRWCRDNAAAFALMVEHGVDLQFEVKQDDEERVWAAQPYDGIDLGFFLRDHPDRDTAVRFAVVQAVIAKLSTQQEG